jgi:thiamine-phosphate pyrophosphorylase
LSLLTNKKTVALGGISKKNIKKISLTNCFGFAGISFFR